MRLYIALLLGVITGCTTVEQKYSTIAVAKVTSVVTCQNPEIILRNCPVDVVDYYKSRHDFPYTFQEEKLGDSIIGYRSDLIPTGWGWGGYNHSRLYELRNGRLELIFDVDGPRLYVDDGECVNGHYRLSQAVGSSLETATGVSYQYCDGHYVPELTEWDTANITVYGLTER
ncbi:MAG: hypothetical protein JWM68_630 [Verrucomicrobiales bacterium]|nr:hypothetical protein [Verrucomicrobiales bacterium]